ncbi:MAG: hypothetical protein M1151_04460 [Candidatus Thermoplasmatota archaeon]|jgi:hypothetical protein|nr:hypothetical protein [Candidatus Thermoplasmatota archaeon]MCL5785907.1 hypothetical protein [Candidatus Thermoplasmatota archaeon]
MLRAVPDHSFNRISWKRDYLLLIIANTNPISATAIIPPVMTYSSVLDIPAAGDGLLVGVKVIVLDAPTPLTDIEPEDVDREYPDMLLIVYGYVLLGAVNAIVFIDEEKDCPLDRFTGVLPLLFGHS